MSAETRTEDLTVPGLPSHFRVQGPLGHGGQGETLAAVDTRSDAPVVVKVFRLAGEAGWKRFELFERECAVLRSIEHPSIPRYIEHGGDEEAGVSFLVMQRADGETLQSMIDRGKRFTDDALASVFDGLLDALQYLHSLNPPVIHRDLKPGNVLVSPNGHVWLVDFGSVRDVLVDSRQSTVVGTYGYMAPEQLRGQSSPASDLYGLGATLAAAAAGMDAAKLPAKGLDVDLSSVIKPGPLRDVLQWMLQPDPQARPRDVESVRAARAGGRGAPGPLAVPEVDEFGAPMLVRDEAMFAAIRDYRRRTGASLAEAMAFVEAQQAGREARVLALQQAARLPAKRSSPRVFVWTAVAALIVVAGVGGGPVMFSLFFASLVILGLGVPFARGVARGLRGSDEP